MAYNGNHVADLNVDTPAGSENPSILDDAIREIKRVLVNDLAGDLFTVSDYVLQSTNNLATYPGTAFVDSALSLTLAAGKWLMFVQASFATDANPQVKIHDGTTIYGATYNGVDTHNIKLFGYADIASEKTMKVAFKCVSNMGLSAGANGSTPDGASRFLAIKVG